jgi:hypothetical protein
MIEKGVGFNRNIRLLWLDATAAFCQESADGVDIGARLEPLIAQDISSPTNIRKTKKILLNIWLYSETDLPRLRAEALSLHRQAADADDRLFVNYGLTLATYPFFYVATSAIGQLGRYGDEFTAEQVRQRVYSKLGQLGSIREAVDRVLFSLRDWGVTEHGEQRDTHRIRYRELSASNSHYETFLLACALQSHPGEEIAVPDLLNLPAHFPFQFSVSAAQLRESPLFEVEHQAMGLQMARLSKM